MASRLTLYLALVTFFASSLACATIVGGNIPATAQPTQTPLIEPPGTEPSVTELPITEAPVTHTPRPAPQPITCTDDDCLNACLERINDSLETRAFDSLGGDYAGTDANLNLLIYKVKDGKLGDTTNLYAPEEFKPFQEDFEAHQLVWNYASAFLRPEELKWVSEYEIFTDGAENTLAWVSPADTFDRSHWTLGVDIIDAQDPVYLTYTLAHEFGHLITLNPDQIPQTDFAYGWLQNPATCKQFSDPNGCTNPDSYINLFYQKFWTEIFDEWRESVEKVHVNSDDEYFALVDEFYGKHEEMFVREYAASNIHEDLAESFMHFILEPKPAGGGIVEQKIGFFYDFPELVGMRKQMIQNICSYVQE